MRRRSRRRLGRVKGGNYCGNRNLYEGAGKTGETDGLGALAADAARELDVLGHDRDALGVDRAQVRVLEEAHEVGLGGLLEREDGRRLEPQVRLEVLRDLAHQALERQLADQQLRGLLVPVRKDQGRKLKFLKVTS